MEKVKITWNGQGGELDSTIVKNDGDNALTNALIKMVKGNIVSEGDSFLVEKVEP